MIGLPPSRGGCCPVSIQSHGACEGSQARSLVKVPGRLRTPLGPGMVCLLALPVPGSERVANGCHASPRAAGWVRPLWWTDGVGQTDPSDLRLRRT